MSTLKIGLFGFGVVGEGIYQVLNERPNLGVSIKKIIIKDPTKRRNAPESLFSRDALAVLDDEEINLVVELIDDAEAAIKIVKRALKNGKSVVSANKKMIALHHAELIAMAQENKVSFLYEAAVCGSVPIIRNLEEYFDNDLLTAVQGIVNGSTNYILSKMSQDNEPFAIVLKNAQNLGFAESDPSLDVEGIDAAYKLSIIATHAFGKLIPFDPVLRKGINAIQPADIQYAKEKGYSIKLIAQTALTDSGELDHLSVYPTFIPHAHSLGQTHNEYNGILVKSTLADEQFFYGKGAGRFPTSSAVLSDISAIKYGYKYEYKKGVAPHLPSNLGQSKFYVGFSNDTAINENVFSHIEERFASTTHNYFVGQIDFQKLVASDFLSNPKISLISFN